MTVPARDAAAIRSRADAEDYLLSRVNYERRAARTGAFRLDGVRALLAELGDPHRGLPAVHVAGTKGKGSVAHFAAAALSAAGLRVGLFISPHLEHIEERFTVDGERLDGPTFAALVRDVAAAADRAERGGAAAATFFEFVTAVGFLHFRRSGCDVAVLEVGLGGRLDATNVCEPVACAVTSISRDHTALLGHTPAAIAREKAGIAKPGVPLVWGGPPGDAADAIRAACETVGAPFLPTGFPDGLTDHPDGTVTVAAPGGTWGPLPAPAGGPHQRANLAVAVGLLDVLRTAGRPVTPAHLAAGLKTVRLPGRAELFPPPTDAAGTPTGPAALLDVAHNPAGAAALAAVLDGLPPVHPPARRTAVIAVARDKDAAGVLRPLLGRFDDVTLTQFTENPRATPAAALAALARSLSDLPVRCEPDPRAAWAAALARAGPGGLACGAGSFFLVAELRPAVR